MYHIAFWVPGFVTHVTSDLDELLEDCILASNTLDGIAGRIVKMTVHVVFVLIVAVIWAKYGRADRTPEVLNVVLSA